MTPRSAAQGVTLVELMLVLLLLGIMAAVVGLTLHTARPVAPFDPVRAALAAARDSAIQSGHSVTVHLNGAVSETDATAYPDGRVIAAPTMGIDPLSGAIEVAH